jgi:hypothetical protein
MSGMRDGRDGSRLSARPLRYCCRLGFRLWSRVDKVRGKFVLDALHYRVDLGGLGDVELETRNIEPEFPGHSPEPALERCRFLSRSGAIDPHPAFVIPQRPLPKRAFLDAASEA